jgi:hypothetical protein
MRDGVIVATDTSAPFELVWDASPFADGPYALSAYVSDALGNVAATAEVQVTVDQTGPYSVSWNTRGTGRGSHMLTARAYDSLGNVRVSAGVPVTVK